MSAAMALLDSVDDLIRENEKLQTDMLWDDEYTHEPTGKTLAMVLNDLDYLYTLRKKGVIYEPRF